MSTTEQTRVVSADVYDAVELVALAFGGIGSGVWYADNNTDKNCPVCINGIAHFLGLTKASDVCIVGNRDLPRAVAAVGGIAYSENDLIVGDLKDRGIGRLDSNGEWRVPFAAYVKEAKLVRGA